ncbi:DUF7210 family protein [Pseudomonas xionganensis]|uniref:DUF7210 domain-containing protein n=1 Tax=Pseudomonas xionganensis TaxID=2654845 RepID=A0A6I4KX94_9PSED|nr:hypothetical protein [Pseudomonas xionganensis]MVW75392.1 hypothetical protein [Pseudomonas xionganensis]
MSKAPTPSKGGTISVVLQKPHKHAGADCQPGQTITVTAEQKAWLQAQGVIGKQEEQSNG